MSDGKETLFADVPGDVMHEVYDAFVGLLVQHGFDPADADEAVREAHHALRRVFDEKTKAWYARMGRAIIEEHGDTLRKLAEND